MNIFYTCDDNFSWLVGISMISVFENNKDSREINVYLLGDKISDVNERILSDIARKYGRTFELIAVPDLKIPDELCRGRWPKSAFTRMFAGELLPSSINKALYLDADTIIRGSIKEVFDFNNQQYAVSGVKDCVSTLYKRKIGIKTEDSYINAGVLLLNLELLRAINVREKMNNFYRAYQTSISYADQDILNGIFKGTFGILPPQYDVMTLTCVYSYRQILQIRRPSYYYTRAEIEFCQAHPVIIHYTTCMLNIRPWCEGSQHPFREQFEQYKAISPWADRLNSNTNFDTSEYRVIKKLERIPEVLRFPLLGFLHSIVKPLIIILKSKLKKG